MKPLYEMYLEKMAFDHGVFGRFESNEDYAERLSVHVHNTKPVVDAVAQVLKVSCVKLGGWMSAAMEDPAVCDEMKRDVRDWFEALEALRKACE